MARQGIVVRYADGRLHKGYTTNFNPSAPSFVLYPAGEDRLEVHVDLSHLKAVFFVRDLAGDPAHSDQPDFSPGRPYQGRKIRVVFNDGEEIMGWTADYDDRGNGFFVFPADPQSNTIKVFALCAAVRTVELL